MGLQGSSAFVSWRLEVIAGKYQGLQYRGCTGHGERLEHRHIRPAFENGNFLSSSYTSARGEPLDSII